MDRLIFEAIPPPLNWSEEKIREWTDQLATLFNEEKIRTLTVPEVVSESKESKRAIPFFEKMEVLTFIDLMRKSCSEITLIPFIITAHRSKTQLLDWVGQAYEKGIRHFILVGGEHSTIHYPGLPVTEAAGVIKSCFPNTALGGVTIFTRKNEHQKMLKKMNSGIEFFVSQIIYETANMKCVLLNLKKECEKINGSLPRVYLSLSAAEKKIDIEFLQWLGVEFPTALYSYVMNGDDRHLEERAEEMIGFVLEELESFISSKYRNLGFNVEQVMYANQKSARKLIQHIKEKLKGCL